MPGDTLKLHLSGEADTGGWGVGWLKKVEGLGPCTEGGTSLSEGKLGPPRVNDGLLELRVATLDFASKEGRVD